jgi:DNA-directed RNA polymerase specialized sigma subunit
VVQVYVGKPATEAVSHAESAFSSYAVPRIVGAPKRLFRDTTWRVRVPRRIQELAITLAPAGDALAQKLGLTPTRRELAVHLDAAEQDIAVAQHGGAGWPWPTRRPPRSTSST